MTISVTRLQNGRVFEIDFDLFKTGLHNTISLNREDAFELRDRIVAVVREDDE